MQIKVRMSLSQPCFNIHKILERHCVGNCQFSLSWQFSLPDLSTALSMNVSCCGAQPWLINDTEDRTEKYCLIHPSQTLLDQLPGDMAFLIFFFLIDKNSFYFNKKQPQNNRGMHVWVSKHNGFRRFGWCLEDHTISDYIEISFCALRYPCDFW